MPIHKALAAIVFVLFHPDYTVGPGITPDHAIKQTARGLYRRWGLAPRPENYC